MTFLRNLITYNSKYQKNFVRYLIWIEHRFDFPLNEIETLELPQETVIELMNLHSKELKRYRRKHR